MVTNKLARIVKRAAARAGYGIVESRGLRVLEREAAVGRKAALLGMVGDENLRRALDLLGMSRSQLNQDFFVLDQLAWKTGGFFVEFGAADGETLSNSWLLEKHFGWSGILAEPGRQWHSRLRGAGRSAALDFDSVWSRTGETVRFEEASDPEFSTLGHFREADAHRRATVRTYPVATVSLNDLLTRHRAPATVDYLSIDTEGSELDILQAVDFRRWRFRCITCEHNFTAAREPIHALLSGHGYARRFAELSQFDDWYVHPG